jgi:hypothetical protein
VIPELLAANGLLNPDQQGDIPFAIIAERHETAPRARDGGELHAGGQEVVARGWVPV